MLKHLMIDLETLDTGPRAVVVQVGAVQFDPFSEGLGIGLGVNVTAQSCLMLGSTISTETLDWWASQPLNVRSSVLFQTAVPITDALKQLQAFWENGSYECVWSNGAGFDVVILEHYYRELEWSVPWRYSQVRDTRTVWWLAEQRGWRREPRASHVAVRDAADQAADVQEAIRTLRAADLGLKDDWLLKADGQQYDPTIHIPV